MSILLHGLVVSANSSPQQAQNLAYGLVIGLLHNGQASSMGMPSLMQYRSSELAGTARKHRTHKR
jgi:hypothetical protein